MPLRERFPALEIPDFRTYTIGSFTSQVGNQVQVWAIAWHVYQLTGSSVMVGLLGLVRVAPILIFSLLGGVVADQFDRRRVLFSTQAALAALSFGLTIATFTGHVSVLMIYVVVGIYGAIRAFDTPARQSLVPSLVPRDLFPNAFGVNGMAWRLSDVFGPMLAGFLLTWPGDSGFSGLTACYFFNFLSFGAILWAVWRVRPRAMSEAAIAKIRSFAEFRRFLGEGISFMRNSPVLRSAMWLDFWATLFSSADALLPAFAEEIFRAGPLGYGILTSAPAAGALLGAFYMAARPVVVKQGRWVITAVVIYGLATILVGISPNLTIAVVALAVTGAADMISTVLRQTIRQIRTPDSMRGRMTAVSQIFHISGPQLGDFEAGAVAGMMGERWSVALGGIASLLVGAVWFRNAEPLRDYVHEKE